MLLPYKTRDTIRLACALNVNALIQDLRTVSQLNGRMSSWLNTLPVYVERVIYLQPELLFFTDIRNLWRMFSEGKVLGVCDVPTPPRRGERNCSDLVFIEVKELRQRWAKYWNKQTSSFEFSSKTTSLGPGSITLHNLILIECCEISEPINSIYLPHQDHRTYSSVHSSHLLRTLIQEYDGNLLRERWMGWKNVLLACLKQLALNLI